MKVVFEVVGRYSLATGDRFFEQFFFVLLSDVRGYLHYFKYWLYRNIKRLIVPKKYDFYVWHTNRTESGKIFRLWVSSVCYVEGETFGKMIKSYWYLRKPTRKNE